MLQAQLVRFKLTHLGQSLLEVIVLIGLALVIVTGLTVVTVNGLKNSQFSQNKAQATRLAQEGIDCVRTVRDKNWTVTISGTAYYWYNTTPFIWTFPISTPRTFSILPGCIGLTESATDTSLSTAYSSTFTRVITIQDFNGNTNQKRITVVVRWNDISGQHQSQLVTVLSNY